MQYVALDSCDQVLQSGKILAEVPKKWLSRDPLESSFPSMSPYNGFGNNPIVFIDPDGRAIETSGLSGNSEMEQAFGMWMDTKDGYNYLARFAQAGQTITVGGVEKTFKKDGVFHKLGFDGVFFGKHLKNRASHVNYTSYGADGRLDIGLTLNLDLNTNEDIHQAYIQNPTQFSKGIVLLDRVGAVLHEGYVHQLHNAFDAQSQLANRGTLPNTHKQDTYQQKFFLKYSKSGAFDLKKLNDKEVVNARHLIKMITEGRRSLHQIAEKLNLDLNWYGIDQLGIWIHMHLNQKDFRKVVTTKFKKIMLESK